jgi:hypothetical protein
MSANEAGSNEVPQSNGRLTGATKYASVRDLSRAMIRAAMAHGQHEARIGKADPAWPDWYAEYMAREQAGEELPR